MAKDLLESDLDQPCIKPISRFALYGYIAIIIFTFVSGFLPQTPAFESLRKNVDMVYLVGGIFTFALLYRIWAIIQIGDVRTTPGKAVGYHFIPIVGIYWPFETFLGWAKDYNKILAHYRLRKPRMSNMLGFAASIAPHVFLIFGLFTYMFVLNESEGERLYAMREKGAVRILHQGQMREGEQLYQTFDGKSLMPVMVIPLPTRQYFKYVAIFVASKIYFHLALVLFFFKAVSCANFLAEKYNAGQLIRLPDSSLAEARSIQSSKQHGKIEVICPECGQSLKGVSQEIVGDIGVCSKCRAEFIIGAPITDE